MRQTDEEFLTFLRDVRTCQGNPSEKTIAMLESRRGPIVGADEKGIKPTMLHCRKKEVESENHDELAKLPGDAFVYVARDSGPEAENMVNTFLQNAQRFVLFYKMRSVL